MLDSLFNTELPLPVKLIVAFAIVLALLAAVMWLFKRFGGSNIGTSAPRGRQPRLAVIDAAAVDSRRRLVLIRRDNVEHLVMIGGPTDVLIEQNIVRAVPVAPVREAPPPREAPPLREAPPPRAASEPVSRAPIEPVEAPPPRLQRPEPMPRPVRADAPPPPRRAAEVERLRADPPTPSRPLPPEIARPPRMQPPLRAEREPLASSAEPQSVGLHPAPPTADTSLASMAHKLEAALRRPAEPMRSTESLRPADVSRPAETTRSAVPPELTEGPPPTAPEPNGIGPRQPPTVNPPSRGDLAKTDTLIGPQKAPAAGKSMFDSLEEEMANLLGSTPPEKKH